MIIDLMKLELQDYKPLARLRSIENAKVKYKIEICVLNDHKHLFLILTNSQNLKWALNQFSTNPPRYFREP